MSYRNPATVGVPQGSVLGPYFFCALIVDLATKDQGIATVQYADDINIIIKLSFHYIYKRCRAAYKWRTGMH